jgi:energy-coupling factor transport system permease protein
MLRALAFGFPFTLFLFIASLWRPDAALRENLVPGALAATVFTLRIVCIALGNLLLISTTDPRELSTSLRAWRIPLEVCLMVTAVLRFMPLMDEQARRILDAQRCRGFSLKRLWHPKAWMPIFVPLLVHALHRSETMATSMELRGLRLGALHPHLARKWRWQERAISATSMIICAVIIAGGGV